MTIGTLGRVNLTLPKKEGKTEELIYPRSRVLEKSRGDGVQCASLDLAFVISREGAVLVTGRKVDYGHKLMGDGWIGGGKIMRSFSY